MSGWFPSGFNGFGAARKMSQELFWMTQSSWFSWCTPGFEAEARANKNTWHTNTTPEVPEADWIPKTKTTGVLYTLDLLKP